MFTGIIETMATVAEVRTEGSNRHFIIRGTVARELKVDQSVAHNGVCLTVVSIAGDTYMVTAVAETLAKTNLGLLKEDDLINIERSLKVGDRLDGHFVQGHVDCTAECIEHTKLDGSWLYRFRFPEQFAALIIEKGSVSVNGVSLTIFNIGVNEFTVTIIPYTYEHTNFKAHYMGAIVNVEFDVLGKYLLRNYELKQEIQIA